MSRLLKIILTSVTIILFLTQNIGYCLPSLRVPVGKSIGTRNKDVLKDEKRKELLEILGQLEVIKDMDWQKDYVVDTHGTTTYEKHKEYLAKLVLLLNLQKDFLTYNPAMLSSEAEMLYIIISAELHSLDEPEIASDIMPILTRTMNKVFIHEMTKIDQYYSYNKDFFEAMGLTDEEVDI